MNKLKNSELNNYFMTPTVMSNGLILYPVNIYDYDYFKQLAMNYIVLDVESRNNMQRQEFITNRKKGLIPRTEKYKKFRFINLFDFLVASINQDEKIGEVKNNPSDVAKMKEIYKDEEQVINFLQLAELSQYQNLLGNVLELFHMVTNIVPTYSNNEFIFNIDGNELKIDRENFYEFRQIIMNQNLLFEPRIAPDPESQKEIDRELKSKNGDEEFDLEATICFVSVNLGGIDIGNYTYYRLMCDYAMLLKDKGYNSTSVYRANGCKMEGDKDIPYPNMSERLSIKDNPYSKDKLYRSSQLTEFDKKLMKNSK